MQDIIDYSKLVFGKVTLFDISKKLSIQSQSYLTILAILPSWSHMFATVNTEPPDILTLTCRHSSSA